MNKSLSNYCEEQIKKCLSKNDLKKAQFWAMFYQDDAIYIMPDVKQK